ncbi:MAG TPA: protein kinase [Ktedonobacteraceae bacterium]|nr:protein kinase [Ktedonobacteraceae bacterium]
MQMETLPTGTILRGRYRIERALGSGGFGHVYLSVDLQTNAQYAIKEYLVTGTNGKAQLEHEAQVLNQLHHPNLPAYLAAFDERGHYYVVLGYIEGNDLTDYIRVVRQKNEVIPIARLMEWLLSICDAVAFLHSQRPPIIHRDIKPDNIRITPSGIAMLVDLGNAKTAADGARTLFFIRHQGTPGYAPLEQYPGGTGTDERSDIYALGGTLHFALTAHEPPSVSARNQALQQKQPDLPSLQERLAQNPPNVPQEQKQFRLGISKPARPAPRHSRHLAQLGMLPPELLQKLDAIIQRAMAMKPQDRYQSVTELSRDLKLVLKALPTSTVPPVVKGRPVDPHSTQPDLPMLYEALQAQDAGQATPAQPASGSSTQSPSKPSLPNQAGLRCPRCGVELTRVAPYCPRCGNPLNVPPQPGQPKNQAGPNNPGTGASPAPKGQDISALETALTQPQAQKARDIADVETLLVPPQNSPQEPPGPAKRPNALYAQTTSQTASPSIGNVRQNAPRSSSQAMPAVQRTTSYTAAARITQSNTLQKVKPFMSATPVSLTGQTPAASSMIPPSPALPDPVADKQDRLRKIVITLAIIIVSLVIVMLLLLVFLRGQQHSAFHSEFHSMVLSRASVF